MIHSAQCATCQVGVAGDAERVAAWILAHAGAMLDPHDLDRVALLEVKSRGHDVVVRRQSSVVSVEPSKWIEAVRAACDAHGLTDGRGTPLSSTHELLEAFARTLGRAMEPGLDLAGNEGKEALRAFLVTPAPSSELSAAVTLLQDELRLPVGCSEDEARSGWPVFRFAEMANPFDLSRCAQIAAALEEVLRSHGVRGP